MIMWKLVPVEPTEEMIEAAGLVSFGLATPQWLRKWITVANAAAPPVPDELVEKAARALCVELEWRTPFDDLAPSVRIEMERVARAIIVVLEEKKSVI